jgi:phosphoglycolate phosphatase-like HAD superfamily hydrolase
MKLVIFDIDGTLIQTSKVDSDCFIKALGEEFAELKPDWNSFPHVTDSCILNECVKLRYGREATFEDKSHFQSRFVSFLKGAFEENPADFAPTQGASFIWSELLQLDWNIAIASGGWKESAKFKLKTMGIHSDAIPHAFANDGISREEIVLTAIERARAFYNTQVFEKMVYVGDGLWDARTCKNLGISFIGIATGLRAQELMDLEAIAVLPHLEELPSILETRVSGTRH